MNPELSIFRISALPSEVKHSILNYLDVQDALKLLKVNKDFRKRVLFKGPFPKKVQEIEIQLSPIVFTQQKRNFSIDLVTERGNYEFFLSDETIFENRQTMANVGKLSIVGHLNGFKIINLIRYCRSLTINFRSSTRQNDEQMDELVEALFENFPFLPFLKTVATFSLFSESPRAKLLFENFRPNVTNYAKIDLSDPDQEEFVKAMESRQFSRCPMFLSDEIQKDWNLLSRTNGKVFFLYCRSRSHLVESARFLLERGIPGKFANPSVVLWMDEPSPQNHDRSTQLIDDLSTRVHIAKFVEIPADSRAANFVLESFSESFNEKFNPLNWPPFKLDHYFNRDFCQKKLFRTKFNGKFYVYLVGEVEKRETTSIRGLEFNSLFPQILMKSFDLDFLQTFSSWENQEFQEDFSVKKRNDAKSAGRRGSMDRGMAGRRVTGPRFRNEL